MRFITIKKEQNNYSKYSSSFASSALLYLFFISNSVVFVGRGARIFLASRRREL